MINSSHLPSRTLTLTHTSPFLACPHPQSKFRHFELVDTRKYAEVWAMKEAEVAALVKQLLQADKVIHEQQLGWSWNPPDDALFVPTLPAGPSGAAAAAGAGGAKGAAAAGGVAGGTGSTVANAGEGGEGGAAGEGADEELTEEEQAARAAEAELQERLRDGRYYGALSLLVDEAGFLVDAKARNMIERLPKVGAVGLVD